MLSEMNRILIYVILISVTISVASCDRKKYARAIIKASDRTDLVTQLDEIREGFDGMPGATIGAKNEVRYAIANIKSGLLQASIGSIMTLQIAAQDLTEAQFEQLDKHVDMAIKQSLDGRSARGLVALYEEVMSTGRGGRQFDDYFTAVIDAAVKDFVSKQKR